MRPSIWANRKYPRTACIVVTTEETMAFQPREWFTWCEGCGLDPVIGIQRAHVEMYIRQLGDQASTTA